MLTKGIYYMPVGPKGQLCCIFTPSRDLLAPDLEGHKVTPCGLLPLPLRLLCYTRSQRVGQPAKGEGLQQLHAPAGCSRRQDLHYRSGAGYIPDWQCSVACWWCAATAATEVCSATGGCIWVEGVGVGDGG
jgi:hypothetical protein